MAHNTGQIIPITKDQITATLELYDRLEQWKLSDKAFSLLKQLFPENTDPQHVVIKATLVDKLYWTQLQVGEIFSMASTISSFFLKLVRETVAHMISIKLFNRIAEGTL